MQTKTRVPWLPPRRAQRLQDHMCVRLRGLQNAACGRRVSARLSATAADAHAHAHSRRRQPLERLLPRRRASCVAPAAASASERRMHEERERLRRAPKYCRFSSDACRLRASDMSIMPVATRSPTTSPAVACEEGESTRAQRKRERCEARDADASAQAGRACALHQLALAHHERAAAARAVARPARQRLCGAHAPPSC
jgi:hypothetical protein